MAIDPLGRNNDGHAGRRGPSLHHRDSRDATGAGAREASMALPQDERSDDEQELSLREVWSVLRKQRWLVLGCAAFVTIIALISTLLQTPLYRSAATVQLVQTPSRIVPLEGAEAMSDYLDWDFVGTQLELVKSRAVAQRAVRQLGLVGDPAFEASLREQSGLARLLGMFSGGETEEEAASPASLDGRESRIVDYVLANRAVENITDSKIVRIVFVSPDPAIAQRVADGLAHAFRDADLARRDESAVYARTFLQDQLQQLKLKLEDSERSVVEFAQRQRLASIDQNTELATASLGQLNGVLAQATAERIKAESRWQQVQTSGPAALDTGDNTVLATLRERRAELTAEYESLRSTFKPDYPELQQLTRRIAEVEARIEEETAAYAKVVEAEYDAALANEQLLRQKLDGLQAELLDLQGRSVEYNILKREADTNRQLYDGLLQRFKEIGVAGNVNPGSVALVDTARDGRAFQARREAQRPDRPAARAAGRHRAGLRGGAAGRHAEVAGGHRAPPAPAGDRRGAEGRREPRRPRWPRIRVRPSPRRIVRCAPACSSRARPGAPRTLLVTSTMQGEGKSTTAVMLARKFAQLGLRVLLVDADMRKPSLHARMNLPTVPGLAEYLSGQCGGHGVVQSQRGRQRDRRHGRPAADQPRRTAGCARVPVAAGHGVWRTTTR